MGFKINGIEYSEALGTINPLIEEEFYAETQLSEFKMLNLSVADFDALNDYYDADGDPIDETTPFSMGNVTYEWKDFDHVTIPNTSNLLGCSGLRTPLELTITLSDLKAYSKYGIPRTRTGTSISKTYKITTISGAGICFIKPYQMFNYPWSTWAGTDGNWWGWNYDDYAQRNAYGGGYSKDFIVVKNDYGGVVDGGFKANATTKFPTTGFEGAKFQIVMIGGQNNYTYSISATPSGSVVVDQSGNVTLKSKPNGTVTVKAVLKSDSSKVYTYEFNPTRVWAKPILGAYSYSDAVYLCGGGANILTREEVTNSPFNNALPGWSYINNAYTRAIGGGIFAEWGTPSGYPESKWVANGYWTGEPWDNYGNKFVYDSYNGHVYVYGSGNAYVACRG
ncbi:hypothetical protein RCS94_00870 [Orbaceae bacterium ac157xtp]